MKIVGVDMVGWGNAKVQTFDNWNIMLICPRNRYRQPMSCSLYLFRITFIVTSPSRYPSIPCYTCYRRGTSASASLLDIIFPPTCPVLEWRYLDRVNNTGLIPSATQCKRTAHAVCLCQLVSSCSERVPPWSPDLLHARPNGILFEPQMHLRVVSMESVKPTMRLCGL